MLKPTFLFRTSLVVSALLAASFGSAQDLAAMAKKEKARRAKVTKPVKVFTEEDGKEAGTKGTGSVTALASEGSAGSALAPVTASGVAESQTTAWKQRADAARQPVTQAEADLAQTQRELEAYRSDTAPVSAADAQDPMRLQNREKRIYEMVQL